MPKIQLMVGGRPYEIFCNNDDEERILSLAESLNERVTNISTSLGTTNESMSLLVAGLTMEDEIRSLQNNSTAQNINKINENNVNVHINHCITEALEPFIEKLEALANSLEVE
jgi:cell division protein ZapA